ncbi:MAG: aminotransferase class V-fold PLP-dependent enzyme, partial [Acutalibacteraceae bacterium]
ETEYAKLITNELKNIKGVTVYDNMHSATTAGVISFNIGSLHSEQIGEELDKMMIAVRAGYHCSALAHESAGTTEQGTVRVSPGLFNNCQEIKRFIFCTNKIALGRKIC